LAEKVVLFYSSTNVLSPLIVDEEIVVVDKETVNPVIVYQHLYLLYYFFCFFPPPKLFVEDGVIAEGAAIGASFTGPNTYSPFSPSQERKVSLEVDELIIDWW
jgi:hypothetical protein